MRFETQTHSQEGKHLVSCACVPQFLQGNLGLAKAYACAHNLRALSLNYRSRVITKEFLRMAFRFRLFYRVLCC